MLEELHELLIYMKKHVVNLPANNYDTVFFLSNVGFDPKLGGLIMFWFKLVGCLTGFWKVWWLPEPTKPPLQVWASGLWRFPASRLGEPGFAAGLGGFRGVGCSLPWNEKISPTGNEWWLEWSNFLMTKLTFLGGEWRGYDVSFRVCSIWWIDSPPLGRFFLKGIWLWFTFKSKWASLALLLQVLGVWLNLFPRYSMYGIFTYIYHKNSQT